MAKKNGKDAAEEAVSGSLNEIEAKSETKKRKRKEGVAATAAPEAERQSPKNLKNAENAKAAEEARKDAKKLKKERKANKATDGKSHRAATAGAVSESRHSQAGELMDTFAKTPFSKQLIKGLTDSFESPTPIQAQAWPIVLSGADLIAVAKTGSGKTLGFLLPALHLHAKDDTAKGPSVLVLAPTRELGVQIDAECNKFGSMAGCKSVAIYGGAPWGQQLSSLKEDKPAVVVATPGRLCDFLKRGSLNIGRAAYVVLDEADRMLDMGFEPQIKQIFAALPAKRQTLFFTATWPKSVRKLAATWLRSGEDLKQVFLGTSPSEELQANKAITQKFIQATDDEKDEKLYNLLCSLREDSRVVVFANTKRRVDACARNFAEFGAVAIHGDKQQNERDRALATFTKGEAPLMFATDVAARGLDIKGVTHVMNFDMARDVESYVHRIGRTGRAGELGEAVTFWNPDYDKDCTPALCKIARNAGQEVPDWLAKYENSKASKTWRVDKADAAMAALACPAA